MRTWQDVRQKLQAVSIFHGTHKIVKTAETNGLVGRSWIVPDAAVMDVSSTNKIID